MNHFTVAIDGPAGAGKSTIAKKIAKEMNVIYVDTGAMYRAFALYCLNNQIDLESEEAVCQAVHQVVVELEFTQLGQQVKLNGTDVTTTIRQQEVGNSASKISIYGQVRAWMVDMQQQIASRQSLVMDGRDIGTHVLPNATLKVFLTASVNVRAKRRYDELCAKGEKCDLEAISEEIRLRDERDMNREQSPLKQAEDAVLLDSSYMTIDEVVQNIIEMLKVKLWK